MRYAWEESVVLIVCYQYVRQLPSTTEKHEDKDDGTHDQFQLSSLLIFIVFNVS